MILLVSTCLFSSGSPGCTCLCGDGRRNLSSVCYNSIIMGELEAGETEIRLHVKTLIAKALASLLGHIFPTQNVNIFPC